MKHNLRGLILCTFTLCVLPLPAQAPAPAASSNPTVKANVDEVLLDLIVRDKKGRPVENLKPEDISVTDDGVKQTITSFRLVSGSEALTAGGSAATLDPLRQVRLVTLAFDSMSGADQRKTARTAAIDLVTGNQGTNVYYSVVVVNTRLLVLQSFTKDKDALKAAISRATTGLGIGPLLSESENIKSELKRNLNGATVNGADQDVNLLSSAGQVANTPVGPNSADPLQSTLARVMLDILRADANVTSQGTRLSLSALKQLVQGLQPIPGRKSVLYFTEGLYLGSELDVMFRNLLGAANRANVTFYSVDTRGVMTFSQNSDATAQLNRAANASATTVNRIGGAVTRDEVLASDDAENSARSNTQLAIRDLAESTGGFLISDSNDLRGPLKRVNEEISSYYELSYNPGIQNYDGSFRKVSVNALKKDLVIHARNGYFSLPPEARVSGLQPFEMPLLKAISDGHLSGDVPFRAGVVKLQPLAEGTELEVLVEVPLHGLQSHADEAKKTQNIHCSLGALVKDSNGQVVEKLTRDRALQVTAEQLKMGNLIDKMTITVPAGDYTLESAVMDRESGKIGVEHAAFHVNAKAKGVSISSLTAVRAYTPNVKGLDSDEPFQFQGGSITPTLHASFPHVKNALLRLFFVVYEDPAITAKPTVEIEFLQSGKSLTKVPMPLPAADPKGRIPYVMTISAEAIPPGDYEIHATAKQGDTVAESRTDVTIEAK